MRTGAASITAVGGVNRHHAFVRGSGRVGGVLKSARYGSLRAASRVSTMGLRSGSRVSGGVSIAAGVTGI